MRNPIDLWRGENNPWRELSQMQRLMDRMWGEWTPTKSVAKTEAVKARQVSIK